MIDTTRRPRVCARDSAVRALLLLPLFALVACGTDSQTGPDGDGDGDGNGPDEVLLDLVVYDAAAPAFGTVLVGIPDRTLSDAVVDGMFGSEPIEAAPVSDSSLAIIVPNLAPGSYTVALEFGDTTYEGQVSVETSVAVPNPDPYVGEVVTDALADLEAQQNAYEDIATRPVLPDSAAYRVALQATADLLDEAAADYAALTAAEQAEVAAYIAANPALFAPDLSGLESSPMAATRAAGILCMTDPDWLGCVFRHIEFIRNVAGGYIIALATVNTVSWFFTPAGKTAAKLATAAAAGVALGAVVVAVNDLLIQENFVDLVAPAGTMEFAQGVATTVTIQGDFRSLTMADLSSGIPGAAQVAAAFTALATTWNDLVALIPFLNVDPPSVPATPRRSTRRAVPAGQLNLGIVTPSSVTGQEYNEGDTWKLAFSRSGTENRVPFAVPVTRSRAGFPSSIVTLYGEVNAADSLAIYREAVLGMWTVTYTGLVGSYQLEVLPDGQGIYHAGGGQYYMSWSISRDWTTGRYTFRDSGFFNGWSPTSNLSMPLSSMQGCWSGDPTYCVNYSR